MTIVWSWLERRRWYVLPLPDPLADDHISQKDLYLTLQLQGWKSTWCINWWIHAENESVSMKRHSNWFEEQLVLRDIKQI